MRILIIMALCLSINIGTSFAQRIVYVDTDYVLDQLPEYHEAKDKLEQFSQEWMEEIKTKESELVNMKARFNQNELLMPEVQKIKEQSLIKQSEDDLAKLKTNRFGVKGDLFKKQQDLIKPIQDRVYNAIKQMAEYRDYDLVLDKATGVSILYATPKIDMSEEVLRIVLNKN